MPSPMYPTGLQSVLHLKHFTFHYLFNNYANWIDILQILSNKSFQKIACTGSHS